MKVIYKHLLEHKMEIPAETEVITVSYDYATNCAYIWTLEEVAPARLSKVAEADDSQPLGKTKQLFVLSTGSYVSEDYKYIDTFFIPNHSGISVVLQPQHNPSVEVYHVFEYEPSK